MAEKSISPDPNCSPEDRGNPPPRWLSRRPPIVNAWYLGIPMEVVFSGIHICRPTGRRIESVNTIGFSVMVPFGYLRGWISLRGSSLNPAMFSPKFMLERSDSPVIASRSPDVTLYAGIL